MPIIGFAFSGPGALTSQSGRDLYSKVLPVREAMDRADKLFAAENFKVTKACFLGSAEDLSRPSIAGPASLALAYGLTTALRQKRVLPQMVCGYGWGELSALCCMGAYPLDDMLRHLRRRGELLESAWKAAPFYVASLTGMGAEDVRKAFASLPRQPEIVADDAAGACVIAGEELWLKKVAPLLASKTVKVSSVAPGWAWPHPSLSAASEAIAQEFSVLKMERSGSWDFYSTLLVGRVTDWLRVPAMLTESLSAPLRLRECLAAMRSGGMDTIVDVGPGEALGAFARKIDTGIRALATLDTKALSAAVKLAV